MSEYITLVQLMESLGNANHNISIVRYWIFDSNYEQELCMSQGSLDVICSPSAGEEQVATFESVFILLYTFGHQLILKKYKQNNISKLTIQGNNN